MKIPLTEKASGEICAWCGAKNLTYGEICTWHFVDRWKGKRTTRESVCQCKKCAKEYRGTRYWNKPPGQPEQVDIFDLVGESSG